MATNNTTIMARAWLNSTTDFQQRIPNPAINGIARTADALFDPLNRNYYNQFMDVLVNRIAFTYAVSKRWENPLAVFKSPTVTYGSSIQEFMPAWIKAHSYDVDVSMLFDEARPDGQAVYYDTRNVQLRYPIDISYEALRSSFTEEYGLNQLIDSIMTAPINSDHYDEYLNMVQQIAVYEQNWGFFKHNLAAAPTDEDTGKAFLAAVRAYAGKLQFPSALYNAGFIDIPVFAKPEELVLIATPETIANIDVYTLSAVFQLDKADIKYRIVPISEFPIPNAVALLTTEDWFKTFDSLYTNAAFYDPSILVNKYYLHHWYGVNSNPFAPAILFTTDTGTTIPVITQTVSGITVTPEQATASPGDTVKLTVNLTGSLANSVSGDPTAPIEVAPDSALFKVTAATAASDGDPIVLNSRTRVDDRGVLHIQKSGLEAGNVLTITVTSTYINPSGKTTVYTGTGTVTIK